MTAAMRISSLLLSLTIPCQALRANASAIIAGEGFAALPYIKINDEEEKRLNDHSGRFARLISISSREKKSLRDRMTGVKRQGKRGACSAFAAIGLIEFYEGGDFSEQCLAYLSSDEDAGFVDQRLKWALEHGLYRETDCPYYSNPSDRNKIPNLTNSTKVSIADGFRYYPQHRYNALDEIRNSIRSGNPVVIDIYTAGNAWNETGILDLPSHDEINAACIVDFGSSGKKCKKHSVIVTGFDDYERYLEFKNSWGLRWPPDGPLKGSGYGKMTYSYFEKMKVYGGQLISK